MLRDCLDSDSRFGVVLIKSGKETGTPAVPYSVGTVARLIHVHRSAPNRMSITVEGEERFLILKTTQLHPYMKAKLEILSEEQKQPPPQDLVESIRNQVRLYRQLTPGQIDVRTPKVPTPKEPTELSYYVGSMPWLNLMEKQKLLEERCLTKRLQMENEMLSKSVDQLIRKVSNELVKRFGRQ